jgi:hypothetical protein
MDARLDLVTPYPAGTTITIGQTAAPAAFQSATDNNPQGTAGDFFTAPQDTTSGAADNVLVTIAGAPVSGASIVTILYASAPDP